MNLDCTNTQRRRKSFTKTLREATLSFDVSLNRTLRDVSALQAEASQAMQRLGRGDRSEIKNVLEAVEKARSSFSLLMVMRSKTFGTYREIMRNA